MVFHIPRVVLVSALPTGPFHVAVNSGDTVKPRGHLEAVEEYIVW